MKNFLSSGLRLGVSGRGGLAAVGASTIATTAMLLGVILLILIAIQVALLTIRVFTPADVTPIAVSSSSQQSSSQQTNTQGVNDVRSLHLFGEFGAQPAQQARPTAAPETTLNIRLIGVTASSNPDLSAAIVQQGNNQVVYIIGETIQSSRAVVREIHADRILIENAGRMETLYLDGRDDFTPEFSSAQPSAQTGTQTRGSSVPAQAPVQLTGTPEVMIDNVMELISITPHSEAGELVGYRLSPKSNPEIFRAAGLRDGDIAIMLNGYDLTNAAEAMSLMQSLESLTEATIVVLRAGEPVTLELRIPNE